jgi:protein-tyrosine-phosphatase
MAEGLLRQRLEARGVRAHVHSAGFATHGDPASAHGIDVLRDDYRIDLRGHRSRLLKAKMVAGADLIVGMARRHVFEVAREQPEAFGRAFTLKELVRRAQAAGPRPPDAPLESWLARLHEGRTPALLWGESPDDDVDDPIGRGVDLYRRTATEIDALVQRLVDAVWGDPRATRRETA